MEKVVGYALDGEKTISYTEPDSVPSTEQKEDPPSKVIRHKINLFSQPAKIMTEEVLIHD